MSEPRNRGNNTPDYGAYCPTAEAIEAACLEFRREHIRRKVASEGGHTHSEAVASRYRSCRVVRKHIAE